MTSSTGPSTREEGSGSHRLSRLIARQQRSGTYVQASVVKSQSKGHLQSQTLLQPSYTGSLQPIEPKPGLITFYTTKTPHLSNSNEFKPTTFSTNRFNLKNRNRVPSLPSAPNRALSQLGMTTTPSSKKHHPLFPFHTPQELEHNFRRVTNFIPAYHEKQQRQQY